MSWPKQVPNNPVLTTNTAPPTPLTQPQEFLPIDVTREYGRQILQVHEKIYLLEYRVGLHTKKDVVKYFGITIDNFGMINLLEKYKPCKCYEKKKNNKSK